MDPSGISIAAQWMPVFPLVGAFVGLVAGSVTWSLEAVLPPLLVGALGLGIIILLNGGQHLDGLLDLGDGIMCHGSKARKLKVMRDPQTGAGGFALGWLVLSASTFAIASLNRGVVVQSLLASEAAASFSMVLQARAGEAAHRGMSNVFVSSMKSNNGNLRISLSGILLVLIVVVALKTTAILVLGVAIMVPLMMLLLANRQLGGITGDVMGATNELTRLASLAVILVGIRWL
jgi:adenosylcobinamide-GDP ribazoletransferase